MNSHIVMTGSHDYSLTAFWDSQDSSLHRSSDPAWFHRKALEHLAVIKSHGHANSSFSDLGCGYGELLSQYLAIGINVSEAIDLSPNALKAAILKCNSSSVAFSTSPWNEHLQLTTNDAVMTTGALNQYLPPVEIDKLLKLFFLHKSLRAMFLFDCVNPLLYVSTSRQSRYDYSSANDKKMLRRLRSHVSFFRGLYGFATVAYCVNVLDRGFYKLGSIGMGYGYTPAFWRRAAKAYPFSINFYSSCLYEYRYHVVISRDA